MAGKDITYWFDNDSREPKLKIDVTTGEKVYYTPNGKYLHIPLSGK